MCAPTPPASVSSGALASTANDALHTTGYTCYMLSREYLHARTNIHTDICMHERKKLIRRQADVANINIGGSAHDAVAAG